MTDAEYRDIILRICLSGRALEAVRDIASFAAEHAKAVESKSAESGARLTALRKIAAGKGTDREKVAAFKALTE